MGFSSPGCSINLLFWLCAGVWWYVICDMMFCFLCSEGQHLLLKKLNRKHTNESVPLCIWCFLPWHVIICCTCFCRFLFQYAMMWNLCLYVDCVCVCVCALACIHTLFWTYAEVYYCFERVLCVCVCAAFFNLFECVTVILVYLTVHTDWCITLNTLQLTNRMLIFFFFSFLFS